MTTSKLAGDGKLHVLSSVSPTVFPAALDLALVSRGISGILKEGKVNVIVEVLVKVNELGLKPVELFDGGAMELMKAHCRRLLNFKQVEELLEILYGLHFPIKGLVEPSEVIKGCVERRRPKLAVRYASIFPQSHMLFCNIMYEFGKRKALGSALTAYEASKEKLSGSNMYIYRTIIDVCGVCKDYMKSRTC